MRRPVITCVNNVYVAMFGDMNIVFTERSWEAQEIAKEMGSKQEPYWWTQSFTLNDANHDALFAFLNEMERKLGRGYISEFVQIRGYDVNRPWKEVEILVSGFVFCL